MVGKETAIAMHLALLYVMLVCHQYDLYKNYVGSVYVGGYGGLSESVLCVLPSGHNVLNWVHSYSCVNYIILL